MDATKPLPEPKTLQEAVVYFSDPDRCFEYAKKLRWPDGNVVCPRCDAAKNSFIKTRRLWFCYACKRQFTIKVKTIMEDSPIGLDKWMAAFWLLANAKNGISSHELGRALGVTQTTAWFMLQRIREVMKKQKWGNTTKIGTVVPNVTRETLQNEILKNVKFGSTVYTDNAVAYDNGMQRRFVHDVVNKTEAYVRGQVHVNGMENFWSLLKRSLRGTYVAVEPFHLSRYVDEQVFRFNHRKDGERKLNDADRFSAVMSQVLGRRLTYSDLTGKSDSPHHSETGTGTPIPF